MREHKIEASHSTDERLDSFLDWFGGNRIPDSHRAGKPVAIAHVRRVGWSTGHSWIDDNSTWNNYKTVRTIIFCGLFGSYIGQYLSWALGGLF